MEYQPQNIEQKWQQYWAENGIYRVSNQSGKPKYYVLDMFPYPSGAGLHVGHPLGYIGSDIFSRYKRHEGFNVLHPMGFDAFGLPAEQFAIQSGVHPAVSTARNVAQYRSQLANIGLSYDWSREVTTSDPHYYKWTQWIFIQLFEHYYDNKADKALPIADLAARFEKEGNQGLDACTSLEDTFSASDWAGWDEARRAETLMHYRLAYRQVTFVNWCEALGTVLANDEVKDGVSERGGHPVERRPMLQWSLRITAYAERMLRGLDDLDWSEAMKKMQQNWIGRSEGAQVFFEVQGRPDKIEIFTTRPDTIFGATFMVLAPEHDLVASLTSPDQQAEVAAYLQYVKGRSDRERMADKAVTGVALGAHAVHPFTGAPVPIWIADYVLKDYGTGAIMAVPSDDDRDNRFAEKYGLPIVDIIDKSAHPGAGRSDKVGRMIRSGFLDGLEVPEAIEEAIQQLEKKGIGKRRVNYKLRDAIFSRQRYWGEPFPIVYDQKGIAHTVPVTDLPVELPELEDFQPSSGGKSPLGRLDSWVNLPDGWRRETDTMPGFAGSSWYFLRYMDPKNEREFASAEALQYWKEVDLYVGGTEHAVGHLMYARFWHKFLYDKGLVPTHEPFRRLINQGMIQGVIEYLYLQKEKVNGVSKFICAGLVNPENADQYAKIPVHIDFVKDYGSPASYLNRESIEQFIEWRPEFKDAIFECSQGTFQGGRFTPKGATTGSHLVTVSEVGKMSKRYFNVVNPDDVVARYGTDCFRMYEMFLGPIEQSKPWDTKGIEGVSKFLKRFWSLFFDADGKVSLSEEAPNAAEYKILHTCIKKVREDIERFSFNTCVSAFMVAVNDLKPLQTRKKAILEPLTVLIAPFAPHLAEELWQLMGNTPSVVDAPYPVLDEKYLVEDTIEYPISINGKKRATADLPAKAVNEELERAALTHPNVVKWLEGQSVKKVIVVPQRMINIVTG